MSTIHEKIASLPPPLLRKVERFVDSLPIPQNRTSKDIGECLDDTDHDGKLSPSHKAGKPESRKAGCMKGTFVMHDNFFEPDDVWKDYM